jgi:membrane dipeptidase
MHRLVINLQGSLANPNLALEAAKQGSLHSLPPGPTGRVDARAIGDAKASGVTATCITVGHVVGPGDAATMTLRDLESWNQFLGQPNSPFALVRRAADLIRLNANGNQGLVFGFQNTDMLAGNASMVTQFAELGVRVMQLTYNGENSVGFGCLCPQDEGITVFGRQAIDAMNDRGVLVDLSHAGPLTLRTAIEASGKPVAISHTACRSLVNNPRNVYDEDLRLLAKHGGVVGIFAMPFLRESGQPTIDDYIRHIEHALDVVGEEHVAIGTDGTITQVDDLSTYLHYLGEAIQERKTNGVAAPGEDEAVALFLPDMTGPSQFEKLADVLSRRGHAASTVDRLLGKNWLRLATEAWAVGD